MTASEAKPRPDRSSSIGRRIAAASLCLAAAMLTTGCAPKPAPRANINSYLHSRQGVLRLHRVVFISLDGKGCPPRVAEDMSDALSQTIQRRKLFHIDRIALDDPACRDLPLDRREAYTMAQLAKIRDGLNCDAVLFGTITHWQTHPRMQLGLYVRLMDLSSGQLIWAVDHTWDSTDKQTTERIKDFFGREMREGYDPTQWRLTTTSPKTFTKFIAYEVGNTLPLRYPPPPQPKKKGLLAAVKGLLRGPPKADKPGEPADPAEREATESSSSARPPGPEGL